MWETDKVIPKTTIQVAAAKDGSASSVFHTTVYICHHLFRVLRYVFLAVIIFIKILKLWSSSFHVVLLEV